MKIEVQLPGGGFVNISHSLGWAVIDTTVADPTPIATFQDRAWADRFVRRHPDAELSIVRCYLRASAWVSASKPEESKLRDLVLAPDQAAV